MILAISNDKDNFLKPLKLYVGKPFSGILSVKSFNHLLNLSSDVLKNCDLFLIDSSIPDIIDIVQHCKRYNSKNIVILTPATTCNNELYKICLSIGKVVPYKEINSDFVNVLFELLDT